MDASYCKCITDKLGRIHLLKPSARVRVRGADAAGSLQDCFTASGVLKTGYGWPDTSQNVLNNYFQRLTSLAMGCGLPASTVKLSPPALDTCEGANMWYNVGLGVFPGASSMSRYLHACVWAYVRVRARALAWSSTCMYAHEKIHAAVICQ